MLQFQNGYNHKFCMKRTKISINQKIQPDSYHGRYIKSKTDNGRNLKVSQAINNWNRNELTLRSQKIKKIVHKNHEVSSNIKIDQSYFASYYSTKRQSQSEIKQLQKNIKNKQTQYERMLLENINCESETRVLQSELKNRREELMHNRQRLLNINHRFSQETTADTEYQKLATFQKEMDNIINENQHEINLIKNDKRSAEIQIEQLKKTFSEVQNERKKLEHSIRSKKLQKQNSKERKEYQRLKEECLRLQTFNNDGQINLQLLQKQVDNYQENYSFDYIEIIQRLFYETEIEKIQTLFKIKQKQVLRQQQNQINREKIKEIKKQIKKRQGNIEQMNKKIDKLTSKIMDKSNQLLEVHEYVPRSDRFSNSK